MKITSKAKNQIQEAKKFIEDHPNIFETTNLNMYDAYVAFDMEDDYPLLDLNDEFYKWCASLYEFFIEDLKMHEINLRIR